MTDTFKELIDFFKNPVLGKDLNISKKHKFYKLVHILLICLLTSFVITPLFVILNETGLIDSDKHSIAELLETKSKTIIFISAVIIAPLVEELVFRGPITLFKNPEYFTKAFYLFSLAFGFIHINNYDITLNVLLFSPILVLPQILLGGYLGYVRVKFGLVYSILLHATYNGILSIFILFTDIN